MLSSASALINSDPLRYLYTDLKFEIRAADLLERMTLEEIISQVGNGSKAIPQLGIIEYKWWNECLNGVAGDNWSYVSYHYR